jgi:chromosome condensin MukBEF MukE localization factor
VPRYNVLVNVVDNNGVLIWGYSKEEGVRAGKDAEETALRLLGDTTAAIDEARASIVAQAKPDLELVAEEQEKAEHGGGG